MPEPRRNPGLGFNESIIATGFWYLCQTNTSPVDVKGEEASRVDNQIDVFGKTFLGLTIALVLGAMITSSMPSRPTTITCCLDSCRVPVGAWSGLIRMTTGKLLEQLMAERRKASAALGEKVFK